MDKRVIIGIVVLVTLALVLSGCGTSMDSPTGEAKGGKPGGGGKCTSNGFECGDCIDNDRDGYTDYKINKRGKVTGDPHCDCATDDSEDVDVVPTEICDNVDNDCDGSIDEDLQQACSTVCGSGVETCSAGSYGGCTAPQPPANYGQTCTVGIGECQNSGTIDCDGQCPVTQKEPSTEICDGLDNDCDGTVDDGTCINETGNLYATSFPTLARFYINNVYQGLTPKTIADLNVGTYQVKFTKVDYKDYLTSADISVGQTTHVHADLSPIQNQTG